MQWVKIPVELKNFWVRKLELVISKEWRVVIQRAAKHYIKLSPEGMKSEIRAGAAVGGWGGWGTETEGKRNSLEQWFPKHGLGILTGLWKPSRSLKSRLFSLPLKIKTSHYLKNVQTRSSPEAIWHEVTIETMAPAQVFCFLEWFMVAGWGYN